MNKEEKRIARCACLKILYANTSSGNLFKDVFNNFFSFSKNNSEEFLNKSQIDYAEKLFDLTVLHKESLDNLIKSKLVNWKIERLALMDKIILRMSVAEMLYVDSVPPKVSISEGVEIAKQFSTNDSSSFINGILDAIYNDDFKLEKHNKKELLDIKLKIGEQNTGKNIFGCTDIAASNYNPKATIDDGNCEY